MVNSSMIEVAELWVDEHILRPFAPRKKLPGIRSPPSASFRYLCV